MSFKLFIYYSALCAGWAALVAALVVLLLGIEGYDNPLLSTALVSGILGLLVAAAVGATDAFLNATGTQRIVRVVMCLGVGLIGGVLGGLLGQLVGMVRILSLAGMLFGWLLVGVAIGASVGVYDLLMARPKEAPMARRKTINGIFGGLLGGLVGGVIFWLLHQFQALHRFSLAASLVVLGVSIGLLMGLAQVILKEAWITIEAGFRAGREMILSKAQTVIGRAESCDIGLFGDSSVEKTHARILLDGSQYVLEHIGSGGTTLLNDAPIAKPTPLRSGDAIKVGNSVLRFGERRKQPSR